MTCLQYYPGRLIRPPTIADRFRDAARTWDELESFWRTLTYSRRRDRTAFLTWLWNAEPSFAETESMSRNPDWQAYLALDLPARSLALEKIIEVLARDLANLHPGAREAIEERSSEGGYTRAKMAWRAWLKEPGNPLRHASYRDAMARLNGPGMPEAMS